MKLVTVLLVALIFSTACNFDGKKEVSEESLGFSTTDDSEIFFKNVRQLYYDLQEMPGANLNVYRIKSRSKDTDHPVINLAIVWNWLKDEAYIIIEPNEILSEDDPLVFKWSSKSSDDNGIIEYSPGNSKTQLGFATKLYNKILEGNDLYVLLDGEEQPILNLKEEREAFRITMADYFRLTRTFD